MIEIIGSATKRTFKCLSCKHYYVKVINSKGGTARACNVNNSDIRVIVDLDAPNCTDYTHMVGKGWVLTSNIKT